MRRRKYSSRNGTYKRPARRSASTQAKKAKSMQSCWRTATDRQGTLTIDQAKAIIAAPPDCPYCKLPINWRELSIDHIQPRSREGTSTPDNLTWSHRSCNLIKGDLNGTEFRLLLEFLDAHPAMKESIIQRMRMAGASYGRWKRRRR